MNKKFKRYSINNIVWDTDGDEEIAATLPKSMNVRVDSDIKDAADEAVNAASDIEGYCIVSADVEEIAD